MNSGKLANPLGASPQTSNGEPFFLGPTHSLALSLSDQQNDGNMVSRRVVMP